MERFDGNVVPFASESEIYERTVFGDTVESDDINDNINADFKRGWRGAVGLNDKPPVQWFNALGYTQTALTSYLYQMGIAEWNDKQEYKINSIAIGTDGNIYQSLVDSNIGNALTDTTKWVCIASKNSIVNSIAELKTISNIESINVLGYYEKGDGGGGTFYWDSSSTETDNGGTIIQATGVVTGRWKRVFSGSVNVKWFGAKGDGITNEGTIIKNVITLFNNIFIPKGIYNVDISLGSFSNKKIFGEKGTYLNIVSDVNVFNFTSINTNLQNCTVSNNVDVLSAYTDIKTTIVPTNIADFAVNDNIVTYGNNSQKFVSKIKVINSNTIWSNDVLTFSLPSPQIAKIVKHNVEIKNINFISSVSMSNYIITGEVYGLAVRKCTFGDNVKAISTGGAYNLYSSNIFSNSNLAFQLFNADYTICYNNNISNFSSAIRAVRCSNLKIKDNLIENGTNLSYGLGIELTAESESYDKSCFNLVAGNTIISANKGVPGSGIGGIHLNFNSNNNIVTNNKSYHNSFGIYLENNCNYNTISNNDCSYNDGWYGVGIELDWDNDYNIISNNICTFNRGSTSASESSGIIIRNSTDHPNNHNVIANNTVTNNGLNGISFNGNYTTITGNTIHNNSIDVVAHNTANVNAIGCGLVVAGKFNAVTGNTINQTAWDSRATSAFSQIGLLVVDSSFCEISGNNIDSGYYTRNAIFVGATSDNINIQNNNIRSICASDRGVHINAYITGAVSNVNFNFNTVNHTSNGYNAIEFYQVDKYSCFGNILSGTGIGVTFPSCTNRYTLGNN